MAAIQGHGLHNLGPVHPPKVERRAIKPAIARNVTIRVQDPLDHDAPAILHEPRSYNLTEAKGAAVVLVSGAGGGVSGPAGIYLSLGDKIALLLGIPCIRLDYRKPARTEYCSADIRASFDYLKEHFSSSSFVLVGWSFGGSPCFTVAAQEPERVRGVATVASQTAQTSGIRKLSPRPLLLLHGTDDNVLSPSCSESLYREYGSTGPRELKLLPGDDHGLTKHATEVEKMIFEFAAKTLGFEKLLNQSVLDQAKEDLVESGDERIREMGEGHDLEGERLG
jgi:pimeloyl-ACP methyl ester carboxylesterase